MKRPKWKPAIVGVAPKVSSEELADRAATMDRAKRHALRGDATAATAEYVKFDRSDADHQTALTWHPYMRELIEKARK